MDWPKKTHCVIKTRLIYASPGNELDLFPEAFALLVFLGQKSNSWAKHRLLIHTSPRNASCHSLQKHMKVHNDRYLSAMCQPAKGLVLLDGCSSHRLFGFSVLFEVPCTSLLFAWAVFILC